MPFHVMQTLLRILMMSIYNFFTKFESRGLGPEGAFGLVEKDDRKD